MKQFLETPSRADVDVFSTSCNRGIQWYGQAPHWGAPASHQPNPIETTFLRAGCDMIILMFDVWWFLQIQHKHIISDNIIAQPVNPVSVVESLCKHAVVVYDFELTISLALFFVNVEDITKTYKIYTTLHYTVTQYCNLHTMLQCSVDSCLNLAI